MSFAAETTPTRGRPRLPPGSTRERINTRIAPRTALYLDRMADQCGGLGGAIDHACDIAAITGHALASIPRDHHNPADGTLID